MLDRSGSPAPTVIGGVPRAVRSTPGETLRVAVLDAEPARAARTADRIRRAAPDLDVALTAGTWLELVHSAAFPTDVVLLDVQPGEPVSIAARIRTCRAAGTRVVVLSAADDRSVEEQARSAGATAVLPKATPTDDLIAAVRRSGAGDDADGPRTWRPAAEALQRPRLSGGEEIALRLYAGGASVKEVAAELGVQYETAKTYLRRIREKYARVDRPAGRRVELIARATEDGYLA